MPRFLSRKLQFDFDLPVPEEEFLQALGSRLLKPQDAVDRHHQDEMKHFLGVFGGGIPISLHLLLLLGKSTWQRKGDPALLGQPSKI